MLQSVLNQRWILAARIIAGGAVAFLLVSIIFVPVFQGTLILDPVALSLGPINVRWYGLIMASAIGIAYAWSRRRLMAQGVDPTLAETVVWWAVIGGLLGARLGFVIQNVGYFSANLGEALNVTHGGLSIHGAVIGGALAVWLAGSAVSSSTRTKSEIKDPVSFLILADAIAPTVLLGAIIGRFGNFMNYELYGYPTEIAWKMFVPLTYRLPGFEQFSFFHPTFLYEALLNLLMFGIILWYEQSAISNQQSAAASSRSRIADSRLPTGHVFFLTLALYSISRFIVEFFRIGAPIGWHLTLAQWISLAIISSSLVILTQRRALTT